ncbi:hypothetical protein AAG906_025700 [Vitis piasezkii]
MPKTRGGHTSLPERYHTRRASPHLWPLLDSTRVLLQRKPRLEAGESSRAPRDSRPHRHPPGA